MATPTPRSPTCSGCLSNATAHLTPRPAEFDVLGLPANASVVLPRDVHHYPKSGLPLSGAAVGVARGMFKGDYECIEALVERGWLPETYRASLLSDTNAYAY